MSTLALFIDFENVAHRRKLDLRRLLVDLQQRGPLSIKRAYADWGRFGGYKRQMLESSVELVELPAHGKRGKNSSDIRLVVDAMEAALTRPHLDTFVIVSSDSDFIPLISKLREFGKRVLVMGMKEDMSALLPSHCDEVVYLDAHPVATPRAAKQQMNKNTLALFRRALADLEGRDVPARGAQIKTAMRALDSGFDEKKLGFPRIKLLVEAAVAQCPDLRVEDAGGGDVMVVKAHAGARSAGADRVSRASATPAEDTGGGGQSAGHGAGRVSTSMPLARKLWEALSHGPLPRSHLARAVKATHFADDDQVSETGLRGVIGQLVSDGLLAEIQVDGVRLVDRGAAGMA